MPRGLQMANRGLYAKIDSISFDTKKFTRALADDCRKLVRQAAQKWLVAVLRRIPVRTGFLAGAFTPLENLVGHVSRISGRITPSRNPLLSREKRLDFLIKRRKKLIDEINQGKFVEKERGVRTTHGKTSKFENQKEMIGEYQKHQRAQRETEIIKGKLHQIDGRIRRLLSSRERTPGGKAQLEVMRFLEGLRREQNKLKLQEQIGKLLVRRSQTKNKGEQIAILKQIQRLRRSGPLHTAHNPGVREKLEKSVEKITQKKTVIENANLSQAERLKLLRANKDKKEKRLIQQVREVDELIGKRTVFKNVSVLAYREFYYYPGGKVLKTPRSGIEFATPEKDIFTELKKSEIDRGEIADAFARETQGTNIILASGAISKSIENDEGFSEQMLQKLDDKVTKELMDAKVYFGFKFDVSIIYWGVNDTLTRDLKSTKNYVLDISRQQAMPWQSLQAGNAAFSNFIRSAMNASNLKSLNHINDFFLTRRVNFDGSASSQADVRQVLNPHNTKKPERPK